MSYLKNRKLASKLAVIISIVLVIIFAILISFTVSFTQKAIQNSISAELKEKARNNGTQVQKVFDSATTAAKGMQSYLINIYDNARSINSMDTEAGYMSEVYQKPFKLVPFLMEQYLIGTARSTAQNNADIDGVGVMFEPKRFSANVESYAFYVSENAANDSIQPFGEYSEYSKEIYYQEALEEKQTIITEPYDYNGKKLVTVASPVLYDNKVTGVLKADIDVSSFDKMEIDTARYPSSYALIFDEEGDIIYDSRTIDNVGYNIKEIGGQEQGASILENTADKTLFAQSLVKPDGEKISVFCSPIVVGEDTWWSMTALDTVDMNEAVYITSIWLVGLSVIALVILICIVVATLKKMLNPIQTVVHAAESIAKGNFDIHIEAQSGDEIGILTRTFDHTAHTLKQIISDISRVLNTVADKNLDVDVDMSIEYEGDLNKIKVSMEHIIENLNQVMGGINESADQVASGSDQVASGAQALSQGATQQASAVEELAATINEISNQVKVNAESAIEASKQADAVGSEMEKSSQQMENMIQAISEISESSQEISKIIKTIEDIAFQTNILALNAAVEAARAGAAGKGFAVVADEVRNLASKSAEASKSTTQLIENSVKAVENGTKIADETAKSLLTAVNGTKEVVNTIAKISDASKEQADSINQVTQGVDQISSVVQTNSATAEESAAASEELSSQAQMLKDLVSEFHLKENGTYQTDFSSKELEVDIYTINKKADKY